MKHTKQGRLLSCLKQIEGFLPEWLEATSIWSTKDIQYAQPRVERLWCEYFGFRVYLHRIHPCDNPLWHPHPWPSAIKIIDGSYEMNIGHGKLDKEQSVDCTMICPPGTTYEMMSPYSWHYVKPIEIVHSIMITGVPFKNKIHDTKPSTNNDENTELSEKSKIEIIDKFKEFYK